MRIHHTTPQDVWNRVKVARRVQRTRTRRPLSSKPGRNKALMRARAYFFKMKGLPAQDMEIFPVEIAWSFVGSLIGMSLLSWCNWKVFQRTDDLLLMSTFGASAMLLFGAPYASFAQPRNIFGGHVISAFVGIAAVKLLGDVSPFAPALAVAGAIAAMHATGTLHPPGGGTALLMATGNPAVVEFGFFAVVFPVATGAAILLIVALCINNLARDRQYPLRWW